MPDRLNLSDDERLREALLDLNRSREHERVLRIEAEALVSGLQTLNAAISVTDMFEGLLSAIRQVIPFEQAGILVAGQGRPLTCAAATTPTFETMRWEIGPLFRRVLDGEPVVAFDVARIDDWKKVRERLDVGSALHVPLKAEGSLGMLICTHSRTAFFSKQHVKTIERFVPLAAQGLANAHYRNDLERLVVQKTHQLRLSEERLRQYAESSSDWFWETDESDRFTHVSDRFADLFGEPWRNMIGKDVAVLGDSEPFLKALRGRQRFRDVVFPLVDESGAARWLSVSGQPFRDPEGAFRGFRGSGRDITERIDADARERAEQEAIAARLERMVQERTADLSRANEHLNQQIEARTRAQEELQEAHRDLARSARLAEMAQKEAEAASRAKSAFLANTSHELRTPMNGILGMAALLTSGELSDTQRHYVHRIQQSGDILLNLLNNILDLSKVEAGRLELEIVEFDLEELIEAVTATMEPRAAEKNLTLSTVIAPETPRRLKGDFGRVQQVLFNLIGNAVKFTAAGGVTIRARESGTIGDGVIIRFEVSDTGIGIPDDARERIFDTFVQADSSTTRLYGGSGLGLAICKQLIGAMCGEIGVDSVPGKGSTFWFTVVCRRGTVPAQAAPQPLEAGQIGTVGRNLRILVAEDNPVNQEVIAMTLENDGHDVVCVGNGVEAVQEVQNAPYDVVLMDIQMPEMDGVTAVGLIRALPGPVADIPIVALTADAMVGNREKYLQAGMTDYAAKPIKAEQLYSVLKKAVDAVPA